MKTLLLRNTQLVDGTGAPARIADVCVRGDRIATIGQNLFVSADEVVDVGGLTVAPGFIDVHTHDDAIVLRDRSKHVAQIVTRGDHGHHGQLRFVARALGQRCTGVASGFVAHVRIPFCAPERLRPSD